MGGLLHIPLPEVFLNKLLMDVKPQSGVVGNVVPAKPAFMWQPGIDVPDQYFGELAGFLNPPTIEGCRDMVMPILEQHSHSGKQGGALDMNVPQIDGWRRKQQLPSEWSSCLCQLRHSEPFQYGWHRKCGWSQNTVPIASTQVAIKGIVQYSTRLKKAVKALLSRTQSRAHAQHSRSRRARRIAHRSVKTSCTYVSAINTTNFIQCNRCVQT